MTIEEAVWDALDHGSLYAAGWGKTATVDGRRVRTIQLQATIFGRLYGEGAVHRSVEDFVPRIDEAIYEWKANREIGGAERG